MAMLDALFEERTVDGICAVVFLTKDIRPDKQMDERYTMVHLYDTPLDDSCWFLIKMAAVPKNGRITLKVPEQRISGVIGRAGVNVKKIGKVLGGKHITIEQG